MRARLRLLFIRLGMLLSGACPYCLMPFGEQHAEWCPRAEW